MIHRLERKKKHKNYDVKKRDKKADRFYHSKHWKFVRTQALIRDKNLCVVCGDKAKVVDHIIEVKDDWEKKLDINNLQCLCHPCHNKKTANEKFKRKEVN